MPRSGRQYGLGHEGSSGRPKLDADHPGIRRLDPLSELVPARRLAMTVRYARALEDLDAVAIVEKIIFGALAGGSSSATCSVLLAGNALRK